jgi:hypothetical protein
LKEASKSLYGFGEKKIELVGSLSLLVSFGTPSNARTEYITFDMVDMSYPYNGVFRKCLINTFEAALHSLYLCLKVPATLGVILVHGNQKDERNIEQGFAPGHRNVNCLQDEKIEGSSSIARKEGFAPSSLCSREMPPKSTGGSLGGVGPGNTMTPDKEPSAAENFLVKSTQHIKDATLAATSSSVTLAT